MKKKVISLVAAGIVALSGVVSAASIWGTYKGNDIVRLTVDGVPVKVSDVPAINYNGRTMVPINLLQQAGVNYTWDQKTKTVNIITSSAVSSPSSVNQNTVAAKTNVTQSSAYLYSNDGKVYLGKLTTNTYDSESVFNEYGGYGSKYSANSVWNEYGTYGSKYSDESAFNKYATKPPIIMENKEFVAYLTINTTLSPRIEPSQLFKALQDAGY